MTVPLSIVQMAERRPVTEDAPMVAALKTAGAMLIGKAATVEFGVNPLGLNAKQGTPRNPHDTSRLTGGSSSGSAGIVAAGICPFATGASPGMACHAHTLICGLISRGIIMIMKVTQLNAIAGCSRCMCKDVGVHHVV